jgi:ABC-type Fe3+ transport system permease subunit
MNSNAQKARTGGEGQRRAISAKQPWLRWGAAALWMGVIYYFSDQSSFALLDHVWQPSLLSISAHFAEYAILAALLWYALRSTPALAGRAAPLAFTLAVLYAISDEFHQSFVPGRHPDVRDVLVDAAGALVAVLLLHRRSLKRNPEDCGTSEPRGRL